MGQPDVPEEQLSDALWPDAYGDVAHFSFKNTIQRLRHLLGIEKAVSHHEGKAGLDLHYCWVDVFAFQHILEEVKTHTNASRKEIIGHCEKALSMYKGDFLAGDSKLSWSITARERLRGRFIRLIDMAGRCCEQAGEMDEAVEYYEKGLETDELQEDFYKYLFSRPSGELVYCEVCKNKRLKVATVCPHCGNPSKSIEPKSVNVSKTEHCPNCGHKVSPDSVFCEECGNKIER